MIRYQTASLVFTGGVIGTSLRWAILESFTSYEFPWPTLLVNLIGCGLLGFLIGCKSKPAVSLLIGTGFCGGLTTFSTFSVEIATFLNDGQNITGFAYLFFSVTGGLAIFYTGHKAGTVR
tara:strand:- start:454 stop:813 length:360 start_codon:yes stop_codon:yes gene_type:complete